MTDSSESDTVFDTAFASIKATCDEAGLEVMEQVLSIIWNRDEVPVEILNVLTAAEVYNLYEGFIGPAVDRVEGFLLDRAAGLNAPK